MTWLLHLYPRAWRARYEAEMRELLAAEPRSIRLAVDLLAGAIDAHVNPHWTPARPARAAGGPMIGRLFVCEVRGMTRPEQLRRMAWLVGGSVALMLLSVAVSAAFGRSSFSQALAYAAFPLALMFSGESSHCRRYSDVAKWVLIAAGSAGIFAIVWAAVALGERF